MNTLEQCERRKGIDRLLAGPIYFKNLKIQKSRSAYISTFVFYFLKPEKQPKGVKKWESYKFKKPCSAKAQYPQKRVFLNASDSKVGLSFL